MLLSLALLLSAVELNVYYAWGWHGGYYLTSETGTREAFDKLFDVLEATPHAKAVLELEPYTLERMLFGEKFEIEWRGRRKERPIGWSHGGRGRWEFAYGAQFARSGKNGIRLRLISGVYVNFCQPLTARHLRGKVLVFSGYVRAVRGAGAHLYIDAWDRHAYIQGSTRVSKRIPPDGKWHFVSVEFTVPETAFTIFPQAKIATEPSVADFDDLSLKVKETGEELLFNGNFELLRTPSLKDEERLRKLRKFVQQGRVEVVGGAYSQPIMYTIGSESVIRQFTLGCRAVEMALGIPVRIYAAQEPDMVGQLPQILHQCGFRGVLYRTHWGAFGFTPSFDAEKVWWVGPDGTEIACIPIPSPMRGGWGCRGPSLAVARQCINVGIKRPLFSSFGDFAAHHIPSPDEPVMRGEFAYGYANLCKRLDAEEFRGKKLVLTAWVRARKYGAHIYIDAHNAYGMAKAGIQSITAPPSNKWHRLQLIFHVPNDAVYIFPQGRIIAADGDADFDAISLRVAETGHELLPNGSFEGDELPEGWGVGKSKGVECDYEIRTDGAKVGRHYVRIRMRAPSVRAKFTTLAQYFDMVGEPKRRWHDAYRGFEHRFPYGLLAGRPQRADRLAEDTALRTERLMALTNIIATDDLDDVWRLILIGHHHDAWVCAPVIFGIWHHGFKRYAELTYAASEEARRICERMMKQITQAPSDEFALVNVTGIERDEIVHLRFVLPRGIARAPAIFIADGLTMPFACKVISRYNDGSAREIDAYVRGRIPPMGYVRATVKESPPDLLHPSIPQARLKARDDNVVIENKFVRIIIDEDGLRAYSPDGVQLLREPAHVAGRFGDSDLRSKVEHVTGRNEGPFAIASAKCRIGNVPFTMHITVSPTSPLVRIAFEFDFGKRTVVGVGEPIPKRSSPRIPVWARDDLKLRFVAPLNLRAPRFLGHGAFELREPYELRLPILRYAIAYGDERGIAIYTDRATMGVFDKSRRNLGIVLAYGGDFIYAPNRFAPLNGKERYELALYFFNTDLQSAMVAQRADEFAQPIIAISGAKQLPKHRPSLVRIQPENAAVMTAVYRTRDGIFVRLWRPYEGDATVRIAIAGAKSLWRVDLRGNRVRQLSGTDTATIYMHHNEIATLLATLH